MVTKYWCSRLLLFFRLRHEILFSSSVSLKWTLRGFKDVGPKLNESHRCLSCWFLSTRIQIHLLGSGRRRSRILRKRTCGGRVNNRQQWKDNFFSKRNVKWSHVATKTYAWSFHNCKAGCVNYKFLQFSQYSTSNE